MRKETREIVELTEKWLEKITELNVSYNTAISTLETTRKQLETPWGIFISKFLPHLFTFILLFLFLCMVSLLPWCGTYKYNQLEISKPCSPK